MYTECGNCRISNIGNEVFWLCSMILTSYFALRQRSERLRHSNRIEEKEIRIDDTLLLLLKSSGFTGAFSFIVCMDGYTMAFDIS